MNPLEPRTPEQTIKLSPLLGTLVCLGMAPLALGLVLFLELSTFTGNVEPVLLRSLWVFGATAFTVRLFQWCDTSHLLKATTTLFAIVFIILICLNPNQRDFAFAASGISFLCLLITGNAGMAAGAFFSKRTAVAKRPTILRSVLSVALFCLVLGPSLYGCGRAALLARKAERAGEAPLKANVSTLARTVVSPTLETPIAGGTNVIWCGTMQLAWNELRALVGEEIRMAKQDAVVASLNNATFAKADVDPDTCVVAAARADDRALRGLRNQVARAFKGAVTPELIPDPASLPQNAFVLYAALFVNLPFEHAFNRLEQPFLFCGENVAAFGTKGRFGDPRQESKVRAQVSLCDFRGADDFVVALRTKRTSHQLILAKIPPSGTLADTARAVLARMPGQPPSRPLEYKDLIVPIADYDLTRTYPELVGRPLTVKNPSFNGFPIEAAVQSIRFKLDERGALLKSEACVVLGCKEAAKKEPPDLIFDKPFLVLLKCATSAQPYFAMWVDNAEILVPFSAQTPAAN